MIPNNNFKRLNFDIINEKTSDKDTENIKSVIKNITLKKYQKITIKKMIEKETSFSDFSSHKGDLNINYRTNVGVLSNTVGSGKTFCILQLITQNHNIGYNPKNWSYFNLLYNNTDFPKEICLLFDDFLIGDECYYDIFNEHNKHSLYDSVKYLKPNLIIVPHNIFNQWKEDKNKLTVKKKVLYINNIKDLRKINNINNFDINNFDIVLCNNNKKTEFICSINDNYPNTKIVWNRVILDEPSTLIPKIMENIFGNFLWLITATPDSLRLFYHRIEPSDKQIKFFGNQLGIQTDEKYIESFFNTEKPLYNNIILKPKTLHLFVDHIINNFIYNNHSNYSLINNLLFFCIDSRFRYYFNNDEKKIYFKSFLEKYFPDYSSYYTQYYINSVIDDITFIKIYIKLTEHICCSTCQYQDLRDYYTILSKCFYMSKIFLNEILKYYITDEESITYNKYIENIKFTFKKNEFRLNREDYYNKKVVNGYRIYNTNKLIINKNMNFLSKHSYTIDYIENILKENKNEKILFFSKDYSTFNIISSLLTYKNISHRELKGNSATINKILKDYENNKLNILMLNSEHYGAGINLQMSDRIVVCDTLDDDDMTQVIGRAQRLGRKTRLYVDKITYDQLYKNFSYIVRRGDEAD